MQLLEDWDPLNIPKGSVRAIVTLTLIGVLWALMLHDREVSIIYASVVLIILGHYFGSRAPRESQQSEKKARHPLGLPRGSIRTIILLGFGAVSYFVWEDDRLQLSPPDRNSSILLLAAAMQAGFLLRALWNLLGRKKGTAPHRALGHIKSIIVLCAAATMAIVTCLGNDEPMNENITLVCAPIIGFYFGARD